MFPHTIARNIFPPVIRKFPSEMYYSKNLYSFSRIKQIKIILLKLIKSLLIIM